MNTKKHLLIQILITDQKIKFQKFKIFKLNVLKVLQIKIIVVQKWKLRIHLKIKIWKKNKYDDSLYRKTAVIINLIRLIWIYKQYKLLKLNWMMKLMSIINKNYQQNIHFKSSLRSRIRVDL